MSRDWIAQCENYLSIHSKPWRRLRNSLAKGESANIEMARLDLSHLLHRHIYSLPNPQQAAHDLLANLLVSRPRAVIGLKHAINHSWNPKLRILIWRALATLQPPFELAQGPRMFQECQEYLAKLDLQFSFETTRFYEQLVQQDPTPLSFPIAAVICLVAQKLESIWFHLQKSILHCFTPAPNILDSVESIIDSKLLVYPIHEWTNLLSNVLFVNLVSRPLLLHIFDLFLLSSRQFTNDLAMPSIETWLTWICCTLIEIACKSLEPTTDLDEFKSCVASIPLDEFIQKLNTDFVSSIKQEQNQVHFKQIISGDYDLFDNDDVVSVDERDLDVDAFVEKQVSIWQEKRLEKIRNRRKRLLQRLRVLIRAVIRCLRFIKIVKSEISHKHLPKPVKVEIPIIPIVEEVKVTPVVAKKQPVEVLPLATLAFSILNNIDTLYGGKNSFLPLPASTLKALKKDVKSLKTIQESVSKEMFEKPTLIDTLPLHVQEEYYKTVQRVFLRQKLGLEPIVFSMDDPLGSLIEELMRTINIGFCGFQETFHARRQKALAMARKSKK